MLPAPRIPTDWAGLAVADDERRQVIARLRQMVTTDVIDLEEFEALAAAVWAAESFGDLDVLAATAPRPHPPAPSRGRVIGALRAGRRGGGWRPSSMTSAVAVFGNVRLDLTEADWNGQMLCIEAVAVCGGVDVLVPGGVDIACEGSVMVHGPRPAAPTSSAGRSSPRLRVIARSVLGTVSVRWHPFRSWAAAG